MLTKFVGVFRELASFNELLHTQVELILVERMHRTWRKVMRTAMITGIMVQYICYAVYHRCHGWPKSDPRPSILSITTINAPSSSSTARDLFQLAIVCKFASMHQLAVMYELACVSPCIHEHHAAKQTCRLSLRLSFIFIFN